MKRAASDRPDGGSGLDLDREPAPAGGPAMGLGPLTSKAAPRDLGPSESATALRHLGPSETAAVEGFLATLAARLGGDLAAVRLFGSAARGDMWPAASPFHSDIDLLVLTESEVPPAVREALIDATYPLFLACGRQISPHFMTLQRFAAPPDERSLSFAERVDAEGVTLVRGGPA